MTDIQRHSIDPSIDWRGSTALKPMQVQCVCGYRDRLSAVEKHIAVRNAPEGLAWDAVHHDGDAMLPARWHALTAEEQGMFRDELEEWIQKARHQPQLFADHGARAQRLLELAQQA